MSYPAETNNGTVTSWVPLTTLYTPSETCSRYFRLEGPSLVAFDPAYGLQIDPSVVCQPSAVTTWWEQALLQQAGLNSAARPTSISILPLICPAGWKTVATSTLNDISTLAMCCPNEYTLANEYPGSIDGNCWSTIPSGQVLTYASTASADTTNWIIATTTFPVSSFVGAIAVVGWNVQQTLGPATITITAATSTPTSSTSTTMSTSASKSSGTGESADTTYRSSSASSMSSTVQPTSSASALNPLSIGAEAGIGLGVALGVVGIIALIITVVILLRRKSSSRESQSGADAANYGAEKKEGFGDPTGSLSPPQYRRFHELSSHEVHELYNHSQPHELPAHDLSVELGHQEGAF